MKKFISIKQAYNSIYEKNNTLNENTQLSEKTLIHNKISECIKEGVEKGEIKEEYSKVILELIKQF